MPREQKCARRASQVLKGREIDLCGAEQQQRLCISGVREQIDGPVGWQGEDGGARWRPNEQVRKNIDEAERGKPLSHLLILVKRCQPRLQPRELDRYQPPEGGAENQRDVNDGDMPRGRRDPAQK